MIERIGARAQASTPAGLRLDPRLDRVARRVLLGLLVLANLAALVMVLPIAFQPFSQDWHVLVAGADRIRLGLDPYTNLASPDGGGFVWSPVAAWLMVPISLVGVWGWRALHVVAALAMPSWRLRLLTLFVFPFWSDVAFGNVTAFALCLAVWALRGQRWAEVAYLALLCLAPKPIFIPVALWLLWQRPALRPWFVGIVALNALLILAIGFGPQWIEALWHARTEMANPINFAPSSLVGAWWVPLSLVLAAVCFWKRRLGFASLFVSPYWLPYYLLMPVLDAEPLPDSTTNYG
ncbi:MAG TPA: hypothetical protein VFW92_10495 [Candidatus Limnocylindrales bacterium]|nr:hypothetical protein [Candidatus Limnocylindrales bacterium]